MASLQMRQVILKTTRYHIRAINLAAEQPALMH